MKRLAIATLLMSTLLGATARADWDDGERYGRFGIGLRTTAQTVAPKDDASNALHMGGGGITLRYRLSRIWALELTSESMKSPAMDGGTTAAYSRSAKSSVFAIQWHFFDRGHWDWYALFGIGGTNADVSYAKIDGTTGTWSAKQTTAHLGIGVEYRCHHFGIGAELRAVGLAQKDDGSNTQPGLIPTNESGSQFNLTATYYF
jgi:hypothetical protein